MQVFALYANRLIASLTKSVLHNFYVLLLTFFLAAVASDTRNTEDEPMKLAAVALLSLVTALPASPQVPITPKRLTNVIDSYPQLSKDGKLLVFQSNRSGTMQIYVSKADRTDIRQLTHLNFPAQVPCWSPDMKQIVFAGELPVTPKFSS